MENMMIMRRTIKVRIFGLTSGSTFMKNNSLRHTAVILYRDWHRLSAAINPSHPPAYFCLPIDPISVLRAATITPRGLINQPLRNTISPACIPRYRNPALNLNSRFLLFAPCRFGDFITGCFSRGIPRQVLVSYTRAERFCPATRHLVDKGSRRG
ncbi:hypothetical protein BP00DRAFT_249978 [Aspergillus indologenus CBS 114.80]|uniref:Uncharacterized protein n=1 Tax=Aspergillus indologenus CBS 114.80 TaxID=1450541 RepID=A0A2V5J4K6_9EURO|nr:hypothetical protein BP00DRAFT_249978 [Aspergillus indologenus CBS 114.80]